VRVATGFLVRAGDLGLSPEDELLVLTNYHVVNEVGSNHALRPADAEVAFEGAGAPRTYPVESIVWSSPIERHDATLLRLPGGTDGLGPLPIAPALPIPDFSSQVYLIGYAGGRDLAFSFQDNELIDHEGPPAGRPQTPGVWRVHYRAATEPGSAGSPVFDAAGCGDDRRERLVFRPRLVPAA